MDPWKDDLLDFRKTGETFTSLIKSIDDAKVISIEAGFGRGKTFFREAWAKHLRAEGEVVVEIDARQSDHSGDPVVTFIGALVGALGTPDSTRAKKFWDGTKKWGGVAARSVGGAVMGKAVDGVIDAAREALEDDEDAPELLDALVDGAGDGLSKAAKKMIGTQLAAEKARMELPQQLARLRDALTEGMPNERVVILIDELDRCHPDYAIQLLEAMKLVFDQKGYVFVLMVNSDHLERIAAHRFVGWYKEEDDAGREPYLDKFVDMRLKLPFSKDAIGEAARALAMQLPEPSTPFGEGPEFTIERAAKVAADLAPISGLSMRQIKRVLLRVELALRCYPDVPTDVPLLLCLAIEASNRNARVAVELHDNVRLELPRAQITPSQSDYWAVHKTNGMNEDQEEEWFKAFAEFMRGLSGQFDGVPVERFFRAGKCTNPTKDLATLVIDHLAPWYIPEHQDMLDAVHHLAAD
ncbi:MAG: P-loop NTPase fold protein [Pseudomonadota bacterium]